MSNAVVLPPVSQEELAMLIAALAAYQHNERYRALHDKLVHQQQKNSRTARTGP